jgi:predicted lipoprotein
MVRTAGSWLVIAGLAAAVTWPLGCGPDDTDNPTAAAALADVLAAVEPEVVTPTLTRFRADAEALVTAAQAWRVAAEAGDGSTSRALAQESWRAAMRTWQQAELMQIGPAASSLTAVAGADVRDAIYSWPTTNPCRVDQETVEAVWDEPDWFTVNLVNTYGLDALEHLLFAGPDNACPGQIDINTNGTWDALGAQGVEVNRAAFAEALATDLVNRTDRLLGAWTDGGFRLDDSVFESNQQALNAVYDALFYLESRTKDRKLAEPLGLGTCTTACAELVELRTSGMSTEAIAANLAGFRLLFTGGEGPGVDDLLRDAGHADLADDLLARLDDADAAAAGLGPIDAELAAAPARVEALHTAVKGVTDLVKGDLATVLALQIPDESAGDND